jgi:hypothetical protein
MGRVGILLWLLFIAVSGCRKQRVQPDFIPKDSYLPFPVSSSQRFLVDSILFKKGIQGIDRDTFQYMWEEVLMVSDTQASGPCYLVDWVARDLADEDRQFRGTRRYCVQAGGLLESSNNTQVLQMVYPPRLFARWDGLKTFSFQDYTEVIRDEPIRTFRHWGKFSVQSLNDSIRIGGVLHQNLVRVVHVDYENALERRFSYALWDKTKGMIYLERWILDTQNISGAAWETKAEKGYMVRFYRMD